MVQDMKRRTAVIVDEAVLRAAKVRAARTGKRSSQVIEEALRRDLGLDLLAGLWERNRMSEEAAMAVALEAQQAARRAARRRAGTG